VSLNLVTLLYLIASVCFIQALKGLSHPTTSMRPAIDAAIASRARSRDVRHHTTHNLKGGEKP